MRIQIRNEEIDVLRGFLDEAREHLEGIEDKILQLEESDDPELVNAIFRPVHTIKGTAAFLGLNDIKDLCHETETVLDGVRKGKIGVNSELVDLLLSAVDLLAQMLAATEEALENASQEGDHYVLEIEDIPYQDLVESLRHWRDSEGSKPSQEAESPRKEAETPAVEAGERETGPSVYLWAPEKEIKLSEIEFPPGMKEQFLEEAEDYLKTIEDILLQYEKGEASPEGIQELLRALHTLKGNAGILLASLEDEDTKKSHPLFPFYELTHRAEELLQPLREESRALQPEEVDFFMRLLDLLNELLRCLAEDRMPEAIDLVFPGGEKEGEATAPSAAVSSTAGLDEARREVLVNTLSQALEAVRAGLKEIPQKEKRQTALAKCVRGFEMMIKVAEELGDYEAREEAEKSLNIIEFLEKNEEPEDHEALLLQGVEDGLRVFETLLKGLSEAPSKAPKEEEKKAEEKKPSPPAREQARPSSATAPKKSAPRAMIKVPQERLDKLMNLVGELVVTKNNFNILARELSVEYNLPGLAKKVKEFGAGVSRIVDELQATIMSIRMVPVGQVFSRFPRLARDLSRKLNKKVKLLISGEETELDKTIIELLGEPLVHLVRNAMDHGLEHPEERIRAGKPEEGTIWLRAYNKGQSVIIEIEDDGRGIDPQKIRAKALERGLITHEDLERLDDRQVLNLIFMPGFSTAEKVSDVSGRGVGMDVVRTAIEKIGGTVELESYLGRGTKISLRLPLTLAISKGLEVEVAGGRYYIPLDYVVETVKAPREAIHWHRQQALVMIRDNLLPMRDLAEALGEQRGSSDGGEVSLVVLNLGNRQVAVRVDRFYNESEFVLKPLIGPLEKLAGFSGATVTGEGRILLVLDPPKLLS